MNNWIDFIKALVRPVLMFWGVGFYTACFFTDREAPIYITAIIGAVVLEYFGERARKRLKE